MNDLLHNDLLDVKTDMNLLFDQPFNFKERKEKQPGWMKDEMENRAVQNRNGAKQGDKESSSLTRKSTKSKKDKNKNKDQGEQKLLVEPWGIYQKVTPDENNNFQLSDLPKEMYEPPTTPKGRLR